MSGYTVVTNTATTSTGNYSGASVSCPLGTQALGGGGEVLSGTSSYGPFLTDSYPANQGWLVEYSYDAAITSGMSIKVWAVCANTGS